MATAAQERNTTALVTRIYTHGATYRFLDTNTVRVTANAITTTLPADQFRTVCSLVQALKTRRSYAQ